MVSITPEILMEEAAAHPTNEKYQAFCRAEAVMYEYAKSGATEVEITEHLFWAPQYAVESAVSLLKEKGFSVRRYWWFGWKYVVSWKENDGK